MKFELLDSRYEAILNDMDYTRIKRENKNKENLKKWRRKHKDKSIALILQWVKNNPERAREAKLKAIRRWQKNNPEKFKQSLHKTRSRRRQLGFITLNSWFPKSEAHHINKDIVVYIPLETHQQYRHTLKKPTSMEEINKKAFFYLMSEMIS